MFRIHINASEPYDVVIENNSLSHISDYIRPLKEPYRVIIVSDDNVAPPLPENGESQPHRGGGIQRM
nr:hypothetical protein [Veillonella denticariosi]